MFVPSLSPAPSAPPSPLSGLRQDSSSASMFAGDTDLSTSIDSTLSHSPKNTMLHVATSCKVSGSKLELLYKTKENEQVSPTFTPKASAQSPQAGIYPISSLLHIHLQEEDPGYESESENEGCRASKPLPKRYGQTRKNQYVPCVRPRGVTAPVVPTTSEKSLALNNSIPRAHRPSTIDLASISPYIKPKVAKAAIGLGLGLPSDHPLQTPRASTAPALLSPQLSPPSAPYLHCRPFSPYAGDIQNLMLRATIALDSPSPTEMLPPRVSYFARPTCPSPLQASQLPSSPNGTVPTRLKSTFVNEMPSPMALYSSAYEVACPPTPCGSPEFYPGLDGDSPTDVLAETSMDYLQEGFTKGALAICD